MRYCIGIDLGGTHFSAGVVDENFQVCGRSEMPVSSALSAEEIVQRIYEGAQVALQNAGTSLDEVRQVGVGSPGTVNPNTGVIGLAANLGFRNTPLGPLLAERFGRPVHLENDANAAAYGEMLVGAAKGLSSVVMMTLGTGVGSGIIIDGKIRSGYNNKGGELGHVGMVFEGEPCTCGKRGCIEAYCSVTGLIRITREEMQKDLSSKMWEICAGDLTKVNGRTSFDARRASDSSAAIVVDRYIGYLAFAVGGIVNLLHPQAIVLGGGISREGDTLLAPLREQLSQQVFNYEPGNCTELLQAKLGNDAGMIGAAFLQ